MADPITLFYGKRIASRFEFSSEDAHHLCRVLRHTTGDRVWAIDGSGTAYEVELEHIGARKATGLICDEHPRFNEPPRRILLLQGLIQQSKMDWLVEKATELGTTDILPVASTAKVGPGRQRRWQRLARSAAKQCRRGLIPSIQQPQPLDDIIAGLPDSSARFLLDPEGASDYPLDTDTPASIVLAVGPEKGFSAAQLEQLDHSGFVRISLGIRRLRAETAAVAALALLQPHLARLA